MGDFEFHKFTVVIVCQGIVGILCRSLWMTVGQFVGLFPGYFLMLALPRTIHLLIMSVSFPKWCPYSLLIVIGLYGFLKKVFVVWNIFARPLLQHLIVHDRSSTKIREIILFKIFKQGKNSSFPLIMVKFLIGIPHTFSIYYIANNFWYVTNNSNRYNIIWSTLALLILIL